MEVVRRFAGASVLLFTRNAKKAKVKWFGKVSTLSCVNAEIGNNNNGFQVIELLEGHPVLNRKLLLR